MALAERLATRQPGSWAAFAGAQAGRLGGWRTHRGTRRAALGPSAEPELVTGLTTGSLAR
jgi:hypothetical protein